MPVRCRSLRSSLTSGGTCLAVCALARTAGFFFLRRLFCKFARRWRSARLASTRAAVCLELPIQSNPKTTDTTKEMTALRQ